MISWDRFHCQRYKLLMIRSLNQNLLYRVPRTFTLYTFVHMQSLNMNALTFLGHQHLRIIPSVSNPNSILEKANCRNEVVPTIQIFPKSFPEFVCFFFCKKIPMLLEKSCDSLQKLKWYVEPCFRLHPSYETQFVVFVDGWKQWQHLQIFHMFSPMCLLYMWLLFCFLRLRFMQMRLRLDESQMILSCWIQTRFVENRDEDDEGTGHIFLLGLWKSICPTVDGRNPAPVDR